MTDFTSPGPGGTRQTRSPQVAVPASLAFETSSYVEWPSIFAGAVVALAVAFVLLSFGAAVGLTAVSPWTSTRNTVVVASIGAAFWMILVHIWAFGLGGYLAGRMRHRSIGAAPSEVEFRDGAHGAAVWGLAVTIGAIVAAFVAASVARSGSEVASLSRSNDPIGVATDSLLRTTRASTVGQSEDVRGEISRILARSGGSNKMDTADRTYLSEMVAARTGLSPADAEKRVGDSVTQMTEAVNKARKAGVFLGFITAATLLLGAVAAWWGASVGGLHRDESTVWPGLAKHAHVGVFRSGT